MINEETKSNPFAPCASFCTQIIRRLNNKLDLDTPQLN